MYYYCIYNVSLKKLKISPRIKEKLTIKHNVSEDEVWECFLNRQGGFLEDTRLDHKTEPPTLWFIAETDTRRLLKVVFIELKGEYELRQPMNLTKKR